MRRYNGHMNWITHRDGTSLWYFPQDPQEYPRVHVRPAGLPARPGFRRTWVARIELRPGHGLETKPIAGLGAARHAAEALYALATEERS